MIFKLIREIIRVLMYVVMLILGQKTNYLIAPDTAIPTLRVEKIVRAWHFFPSIIISILLVVKIFPLFSTYYAGELESNSGVIPAVFVPSFLVILILNGIVIEKILQRSDASYAEYKRSLISE